MRFSGLFERFNPVTLRLAYTTGLVAIITVSGAGIAYCGWLILSGDQRGLINIGKCLVLLLYGSYRLRSILNQNYMIYRPWESTLTKGIKRIIHRVMFVGILLFILSGITLLSLANMGYLIWFEISLVIIVFSFITLEITNALNSRQVAKS